MGSPDEIGFETRLPIYDVVIRMILGTVITCENVTLLLVIFKRKLYDKKYLFTASLGVTDLSVGVILVVCSPLALGTGSVVGALLSRVLTAGMLFISILQMALIALERYLYVARPFFYERRVTERVIRWIIALLWIIGLLMMSSYGALSLCLLRYCHISEQIAGRIINNVSIFSLSAYFCVIFVTGLCYALILMEVSRHKRAIACTEAGSGRILPKWKERVKSLKFFMTVFGVYFIMTSPSGIYHSIHKFYISYGTLYGIFTILIYANSGMNFFIMILIDRHFRASLKSLLCSASGTPKSLKTSPVIIETHE